MTRWRKALEVTRAKDGRQNHPQRCDVAPVTESARYGVEDAQQPTLAIPAACTRYIPKGPCVSLRAAGESRGRTRRNVASRRASSRMHRPLFATGECEREFPGHARPR